IAFDPTDSNTVYATYSTFGGAHVWKSTDAGASWSAADGTGYSTIPDMPVNSVVVDPLHASRVYLGTDLGVFVSTNAGASWAVESSGFGRVPVVSLVLRDSTLFAFTQGGGVWCVTIGSDAGPLV